MRSYAVQDAGGSVRRERSPNPARDEVPQEPVQAALSARVRSATRSSRLSERRRITSTPASGSTAGSRSLRQAASAVARASRRSFLRALPVESNLTFAESLGGTSTTDSPAAESLWAKCLPNPPAFSMAQRRLGKRFAQRSRVLKPERFCGKVAHSRSSPSSLTAATAIDALWGSTPISTCIRAPPFRVRPVVGVREGHSDFEPCTPLLSHPARRTPVGRKPRTSQPFSNGRQDVRERSLLAP